MPSPDRMIHEIVQQLAYTSLFGDWRMLKIYEADAIPPVAQVRFLALWEALPRGVAVACTSNCEPRDFEERFRTRFQEFEIAPPTTEKIVALLRCYLPDEPEAVNAAILPTATCGRRCGMPKDWGSAASN